MQTITKHFKTLKQAEKYQDKLYQHFPYCVLISYPIFSDEGQYTWEVSI